MEADTSSKQPDVKPKYTTSENIDIIMESVIERGIGESEKYPDPEYSDGDWDMEADTSSKQPAKKVDDRRKKKPNKRPGSPNSGMSDMFSGPQHFTANTQTPPKQKMKRIPNISQPTHKLLLS